MQLKDRMIFAGMYTSERVGALTWLNRWLYSALLHLCDDFGLFEADAALIRGASVPRDTRKVSVRDVESGLGSIQQAELVKFYTISGKRYGALWNYRQKKGYRWRKQLYPTPPPDIVSWMCVDGGNLPGQSRERPTEPEPNQTNPNQGEVEAQTNPMGVSLAALAGYALENCSLKLGQDGAGKALNAVGAEHDRALVAALEHLASRDDRTRWQDSVNPMGLLISIAKDIRDGIGPRTEGEYEPFENWCARHETALTKAGRRA